jgi:predicted dehydrogenase
MHNVKNIKRVLIVGLGSIGKRHLQIIRELYPKIKITILRHRECINYDNNKLDAVDCVTSVEEALKFQPDVAIIATPSTKHIGISNKLARAGVHLLIEKPISEKSDGVQSLINFCHESKIVLMTAYNLRFLPSLLEFRRQFQCGIAGKALSVSIEVGQYLPNWRPDNDYSKTVSAKKSMGGGVLLELSHEIDYMLWIFGSVEWVKSCVSRQSSLKLDVEDTVDSIIRLKDSKGNQIIATLHMDFIRQDNTRKCTIVGDKGTLKWNANSGKVKFFSKQKQKWEVVHASVQDRNYTYMEEIKHFFSCVENSNPVFISGDDGLRVLLVIEAIRQSSNNGNTVFL